MVTPETQRSSKLREWLRTKLLSKPLKDITDKDKKILDLGCGWGIYFKINSNAWGIDIDKKCIDYLRSRNYKVVQGNLLGSLPFESDFFDVVICHDVLEHFELDETKTIFYEVHRILKKRGVFLIIIPNRKGYEFGLRINAGHKHFINLDEIRAISKDSFILRKHHYYPLPKLLGSLFTHNKEIIRLEKS